MAIHALLRNVNGAHQLAAACALALAVSGGPWRRSKWRAARPWRHSGRELPRARRRRARARRRVRGARG
eukprot:6198806-Pleurochrysis_carterae.AAC.2